MFIFVPTCLGFNVVLQVTRDMHGPSVESEMFIPNLACLVSNLELTAFIAVFLNAQ